MIGAKKAVPKSTPKATSALGALESLKRSIKGLSLGRGGSSGSEPNWNAIKAAKEMQAQRTMEFEKYRALVRRY